MKKFKKLLIVTMLLCTTFLAGCKNTAQEKDKLQVVCTLFPQYDWAKNMIGTNNENIELTLLLDSGSDIHSYQPTTKDIVTISDCDVFIYSGGESEEWVEDILKEAKNKEMTVLNLMECLGDAVKEEEIIEGMETDNHSLEQTSGTINIEAQDKNIVKASEDMDMSATEDTKEETEEEVAEEMMEHSAYDEHIWLSLKNAKVLCEEIKDVLVELDSKNAKTIEENYQKYVQSLDELDKEFETMTKEAKRDVILVADRFPFLYLMDDYEIDYYAAFPGCSADTEASFETLAFLTSKLSELKLPVVCVLENSDQSVAKTIINNTTEKSQVIKILDSMQSVRMADIEKGTNYLSIMRSNFEVLKMALN